MANSKRIVTRTSPGLVRATYSQESFWLLQQMEPRSQLYDLRFGIELRGELNIKALEHALDSVLQRHESLRTNLVELNGQLVQVVTPTRPRAELTEVSLHGTSPDKVLESIFAHFPVPDLAADPLFRAELFYLDKHNHILGIAVHHCVSDGWSMPLLGDELREHYCAFIAGRAASVPALPVQYTDYAEWQRRHLADDTSGLTYWGAALAGAPAALTLATDRPRSALRERTSGSFSRDVAQACADGMRRLATGERVSEFMVGLAALAAVLARWTDQSDLVIATPVAGRSRPELQHLIGCFMNTVSLRLRVTSSTTFRDLVRESKRVTVNGLAHQDTPFGQVVQHLGVSRSATDNPFATVGFSVDHVGDVDRQEWGDLRVRVLSEPATIAVFDLTLTLRQQPQGMCWFWHYADEIFDESTVRTLARQFDTLLAEALHAPDLPVVSIPLTDAAERDLLAYGRNETAAQIPSATLDELIAAQVRRTPDAPAITCRGQTITFADFDLRVAACARLLREHGIQAGQRVGLCIERSAELVVAMAAVIRAQAVYVPADPAYPVERIRMILDDSGASVVLATRPTLERIHLPAGLTTICLDSVGDAPDRPPVAQLPPASPETLAYVIYTSGSTGRPKGVAMAHGPVVNVLSWVNTTFGVGPGDCLLFVTSASFDLSVYDVFGTLAAGARIVVATEEDLLDPERLLRLLVAERVTIWDSAPAVLGQVMLWPDVTRLAAGSCLRLVMLSGDWIPMSLPDRVAGVFPHATVAALGGATEAAIWSNAFQIGEVEGTWPSIPYGYPITNARYYILDHRLQPVPSPVAGDLYIGGPVLARGYHGRPALTAERFLPDPFSLVPGGRMYATGDRARVTADGPIEFLGRLDDQVKIRGYRVELGEVETALGSHPDVAACAVAAHGAREERSLTAYVVAVDREPGQASLRAHLAERVPGYMMPSRFVMLDALPLTANGKVDRARLPQLAQQPQVPAALRPPATPTEKAVAGIWQGVLELDDISSEDNFFQIGGHSLAGLQVIAQIRSRFQVELPTGFLIANQTIGAFAAALDAAVAEHAENSPLVMLRGGDGPAVVVVHPVGGGVTCYAELISHLTAGPVYGFESRRPTTTDLRTLAEQYAEEVRRSLANRSLVLVGWSFGALLALDIAHSLADAGVSGPPVVVLDPIGIGEPPVDAAAVTENDLAAAFVHDFAALAGVPDAVGPSWPATDTVHASLSSALAVLHGHSAAMGVELDEFTGRYEIFRGNVKALLASGSVVRSASRGYEGPVHLVEAEESQSVADWLVDSCSALSISQLPGDHFTLLSGRSAVSIASLIDGLTVVLAGHTG
jgi:amino acid adenylation domain-containing protein